MFGFPNFPRLMERKKPGTGHVGTQRYPPPSNGAACARYRLRRHTYAHACDTSIRLLLTYWRLKRTTRNALSHNTLLYNSFVQPDAILRRSTAIRHKISSAAQRFPNLTLPSLPPIPPLGLAPNGAALLMSRSNVGDIPVDLG